MCSNNDPARRGKCVAQIVKCMLQRWIYLLYASLFIQIPNPYQVQNIENLKADANPDNDYPYGCSYKGRNQLVREEWSD